MFIDILKNVIVGFIGGAIISVGTFIYRFYLNKKLEKKFPVSGKYLTKYEDLENGIIIERTAPAILKQKGRKITGETTFDNNRKWIIEGQIEKNGHIHGIYYAENPLDKGIGNFFLKIDAYRNMHGLWSGYDSENNLVSSGKYVFRPTFIDYDIVDIEEKHIPHILNIADSQLGNDYLSSNIINSCINNKDDYIGKVSIDHHNNKVVGFYMGYKVSKDDVVEMFKDYVDKTPRILRYSNIFGLIKTVAVDDNYKNRGIGTKLIRDAEENFLSKNINTIFTVAWKSKEGTNLKGILEYLGYKELFEILDYWKEDSIENNYNCPSCGNPPCTCSAVIYSKAIM